MNRFLLFLCLLFFANSFLFSQCYVPVRDEGIGFYNKAQYSKALSCFTAAQKCPDKPANNDLKKWIEDCNVKLKSTQETPKPVQKPPTKSTQTEHQEEVIIKEIPVCYVPTYNRAKTFFTNKNFIEAKKHFLEAQQCADLPLNNDAAVWIKKCEDELANIECIKINYTQHYNAGKWFYNNDNFEKAKDNFERAAQSQCKPDSSDIAAKIVQCNQKLIEKRFSTLHHDTITCSFWGKECVFIGPIQYNKPYGKGLLTFQKDQSLKSIEGYFADGIPQGIVHCIFNNQDEYTGILKDDNFERGSYKYAQGDVYEGVFIQRVPNGKGKINYTNGDIYDGIVVNGKKEGTGTLTAKSGSFITNLQGAKKYEGNWVANQKSGFGKCYDDQNVLIHEGNFTNDFPENDYPNRLMRIPFKFVKVPEGTFTMGCTVVRNCAGSDDRPARAVTLSEFQISNQEVTVAQYRTFCEATGRSMPRKPDWSWEDDNPIVNVTWNDAVAFCQWTNCRLPTEAEWEYAAQGAKEPRPTLFSGSNELREVAYFMDNTTRARTVGKKKPNELLLYDMSGNVSEWVQDWFGVYPQTPQQNPQGASRGTHKVVRGGNWQSASEECRITYRGFCDPNLGTNYIGFRVVRK